MRKPDLSLDIDDALHAIRVQQRDDGPRVPVNPLGRLVPDTPDAVQLPSRKAALGRMRTARLNVLRSFFLRKHLSDKPE